MTEKGEQEIIEQIVQEIISLDRDDESYQNMIQTPAFNSNNDVMHQQKQFENFLCHIFDQPIEKTYRRNRFYWGERYERKQKIGNKFYWMCRKAIPVRDTFKRLIKRK